jgi:PE-PPE domain-containing protein
MGAIRTYFMAGAALAGGGVIAVGPAMSIPAGHISSASVRLAAGDEDALIMGGGTVLGGSTFAGTEPTSAFVTDVYDRFLNPTFAGFSPVGLPTPEQDWPLTGPFSLPFNLAIDQSVGDLDTAITQTYQGDDLAVLGYSQSTVAATMEMNALDALPADQRPDPADLHFTLLGDMNNPDGGIYERFGFLNPFMNLSPIAALNQPYFIATPPDTPYPTDIYTIQYDGVADFPQYPIDIPADLNAGMGVVYSHLDYASLTPEQLGTAQLLPGSADLPGGVGATDYYLIPVQHLPLLEPLYESGVGAPLADLLSPDLTYIVNLGYGTGPANVPTPAGLFPNVDPTTVLTNLEADTVQGVNNALADLTGQQAGSAGSSLPDLSNIFATLSNGLADQANDTALLGSLSTLLPDMSSLVGSLDAFGLDPALFTSFLGL